MSSPSTVHVVVHSNDAAYTIDSDNPYLPTEINSHPRTPLLNSYIDMPPDILGKALDFQRLKWPVRCVATFDIFMIDREF